jgi:hypothetical protein
VWPIRTEEGWEANGITDCGLEVDMGHRHFAVLIAVGLALGISNWAAAGDEETRAGHPQEVRHLAAPSDTGHYIGYQVGGGATLYGRGPTEEEGVWGWDYSGVVFHRCVVLKWFKKHERYQGGVGAYRTDREKRGLPHKD